MAVGIINSGSLGAVGQGNSKVVSLTSAAASVITAASMGAGCVIRVLNMSSTASQITFGNANLTADSGTQPGTFILQADNEGLTLNIVNDWYGIVDSGTATVCVAPLLVPGFGARGGI
jgi:hypothetical protein